MFKKLFLSAIFVCNTALAGGTVMYQPKAEMFTGKVYNLFGLYVNEPILEPVHYDSWNHYQINPDKSYEAQSKHGLKVQVGNLGIRGSLGATYTSKDKKCIPFFEGAASLNLW